jgi:hypothetical protein
MAITNGLYLESVTLEEPPEQNHHAGFVVCDQHQRPRLGHSVILLIQDRMKPETNVLLERYPKIQA